MFKKKSPSDKILYSDIKEVMNRRLYHFPKKIRNVILDEMIECNLIKKINKQIYELNLQFGDFRVSKANITIE